ncbi:DUF4474 domain-containing protein [Luteimonas soli]|uniref:DUF4474 domain-containing protein n=1 Tax=Luteimonas soli TaxID=1648966 RepID=A0ABV7XI57_9GAMM
MPGPIDSLRQFYDQTVRPLQDNLTDIASDVAEAATDVGGAVVDGARDVAESVAEEGVVNVGVDIVRHNVAQGAEILAELGKVGLGQSSPQDFVDWLAGPEGPSFADQTALVPGLQEAIGDVIDTSMENPMIAGAIGQAFGFEYVPEGDFYTTNESSMQSYFGFHDAYDKVGKLLGMDLDDEVVEFEVDGTEYRLELWKGSYGNGGAFGGEIGFYTRGTGERGPLGDLLERIPGYYSSAAGDDQIRMTQTIYDTETGEVYFTNDAEGADGTDGEHFWNLAIRTDPGVNHEDIGQRGTLVLDDPDVAEAMCAAMNREEGITAELGDDGLTISYVWE